MATDLIELCGLNDFKAMRLSANGQDPDQLIIRPSRRICMRTFNEDHEIVRKTSADIVMDLATRTTEDRQLWFQYLWALAAKLPSDLP